MRARYATSSLHPHVRAIMAETAEQDPFCAVRAKTRELVAQYHQMFGEPPPFNMKALASYRGLRWSDDDPCFSSDAEIAPEANGAVVLRVNQNRPLSRQRFSIGHEIGHTMFPEYELAVRCRNATERMWADPADLLETLCDVSASEILFPEPWFHERIAAATWSASMIADIANEYQASREATVRRLLDIHTEPLAAVIFSWKLKPLEQRAVRRNRQQLPISADLTRVAPAPMLRVDYAILNDAFEKHCVDHIPKDKSVPSDGPIHQASVSLSSQDGLCSLDFGTLSGRFTVHALPIFTSERGVGPDGACSVLAVIRPSN